ncbi:unnamed protein product [Thelazia callipaeda]|uniref:PG_binding_1 domain-containing protein n=1 Tax=Thelazia callipaeda TaxID=103827 RepID=A0A0N5CTG4_THECL|nr:unnamed protein product [Thelazia callipaeda]
MIKEQYLSNYGYSKEAKLTPGLSASASSLNLQQSLAANFRDNLKKFQKFTGLKPTGILDQATKNKMLEKRCGRPDIMELRLG